MATACPLRRLVRQEQPTLGEEVVVEVAVEVQMVAREVGEDDRVEGDADRPVQGQSVRADLERARLIAGDDHLAEHALQVQRLGGGEQHGVVASADAIDDGAQQRRLAARRRR